MPSLRIITRLPLTTATHISRSITDDDLSDAELELHDEGDDSRLVDKARTVEDGKQCIVTYDILLSPIYCVPVLYFHLIPVRPLEDLVPKLLRSQMQHVGVMGAVSTTVSISLVAQTPEENPDRCRGPMLSKDRIIPSQACPSTLSTRATLRTPCAQSVLLATSAPCIT